MNGQQLGKYKGFISGRQGGMYHGSITGRHSRYLLKKKSNVVEFVFEQETLDYWERIPVSMPLDAKYAYNTLIKTLKDNNIWQLADIFRIYATMHCENALLNIINDQHTAVPYNSMTFTAGYGYKYGGTGSYIDENFNPYLHGNNYELNNCIDLVDSGSVNTLTWYPLHIGLWDGTNWIGVPASSSAVTALNSTTFDFMNKTDVTGIIAVRRINATNCDLIQNANVYQVTKSSSAIPNVSAYTGCLNYNGSAVNPSDSQYRAVFKGAALTNDQILVLSNALSVFYSSIRELC